MTTLEQIIRQIPEEKIKNLIDMIFHEMHNYPTDIWLSTLKELLQLINKEWLQENQPLSYETAHDYWRRVLEELKK